MHTEKPCIPSKILSNGAGNSKNARLLRWLSKMDARDYDRIGDLLTQIHRKISQQPTSHSEMANKCRENMLFLLDTLLAQNDILAKADDKGLL